jgi:DNA helicase HerA-like ATPase
VYVDTDRPHVCLVVGKRGSGKTYTLGVLAEGVVATPGATPVVVDPMGEFDGLVGADRPGTVHREPTVRAAALPPRAWPPLVGLDPASGAGSLVWHAAERAETLPGIVDAVTDADAAAGTRRVARNHLRRAEGWDAFDADGLAAAALTRPGPTVVDCSGLSAPATNAVCRVLAVECYERCGTGEVERLPWLFVDEAHVAFDGVAAPALRRLFTRGRTPGVSVVCATQRPGALPDVAVSQADLLVAHALDGSRDAERLAAARPATLSSDPLARLPDDRGAALVVDDATETATVVAVRRRRTQHGGDSPRASEVAEGGDRDRWSGEPESASVSPRLETYE